MLAHLWEDTNWRYDDERIELMGRTPSCSCCSLNYEQHEITFEMVNEYIASLEKRLKEAKRLKRKYFTKEGKQR